jgi:hypothetical protein
MWLVRVTGLNVASPPLVEREKERLPRVELERDMSDAERDVCFRAAWSVFGGGEREIQLVVRG